MGGEPADVPTPGRGTGLWTGTLVIGEFLSPVIIAAIGGKVGGPQPALAVLGVAAALMPVVTLIMLRRNTDRLDLTRP